MIFKKAAGRPPHGGKGGGSQSRCPCGAGAGEWVSLRGGGRKGKGKGGKWARWLCGPGRGAVGEKRLYEFSYVRGRGGS